MMMMKYFLFILALTLVVSAKAQTALLHSPRGAMYQIFTQHPGDKIKLNDVVTLDFIEKTDKDSIVRSTYAEGKPIKFQVTASQNITDLMEIYPLLALKDSALVKVPSDSIFVGHEDRRPPFFPKGSFTTLVVKIERIQSLNAAIAERDSLMAIQRNENAAEAAKFKAAEAPAAAKYIASHKLVLKTTASGLKYVITKPSLKRKPLTGDTLLVNYAGRDLNDKVFDSSIEAIAKAAGLEQPGRTYEPYQVTAGVGQVIAGWNEGLLLMNEGSKATFVIPSNLAYGEQGNPPVIGPYSTLVFDLELVKIKPIKHPVAAATVPAKKPLHKAVAKKKAA